MFYNLIKIHKEDILKFIFPKNYKYNRKILGFLDYKTAIIDLSIGIILFLLIRIIFNALSTQIYVFIILFLPILLFSILGTGGESIIEFTIYIIKFFKNQKIYFYEKTPDWTQKIENFSEKNK